MFKMNGEEAIAVLIFIFVYLAVSIGAEKINARHKNPITSKPYHIFVEHITQKDLAYCRKDENCIDIMEIDDLCTREQLGLPTK